MDVVARGRHAGKTTKIVEYALLHNLDILVVSPREKERLLKEYVFLQKDQVFTLEESRRRRNLKKYAGTAVDNADVLLQDLIDSPIKIISMTGEPESRSDPALKQTTGGY